MLVPGNLTGVLVGTTSQCHDQLDRALTPVLTTPPAVPPLALQTNPQVEGGVICTAEGATDTDIVGRSVGSTRDKLDVMPMQKDYPIEQVIVPSSQPTTQSFFPNASSFSRRYVEFQTKLWRPCP